MASTGYLYYLVRCNTLLHARNWGFDVPDEAFPIENYYDDSALLAWNGTYFTNADGYILRFVYMSSSLARTIKMKGKGVPSTGEEGGDIGVDALEQYITSDNKVTTILVLGEKLTTTAKKMAMRHFPYVYKFENFIMYENIYESESSIESNDILMYLTASANYTRPELIIRLNPTDMHLYTAKDFVPYVKFMKRENTIFSTLRQETIPNTYPMINYRYVGSHYKVSIEELDMEETIKEENMNAKKQSGKTKREKEDDLIRFSLQNYAPPRQSTFGTETINPFLPNNAPYFEDAPEADYKTSSDKTFSANRW